MSRSFAVAILVVLLASFLMSVEAQPSKSREPRASDRTPGEATENATSEGKSRRPPGRFSLENGSVDGRYIDFRLDLAACQLLDYRVYEQVFLVSLDLGAEGCEVARGDTRARFEMRADDARLRAHDAPNGLLQFQSDGEAASLVVASNVEVTQEDGALALTLGNLSARVFAKNGSAIERDGLRVMATNASFMVHPASGASAERRAVFDAIQKGKVGAETDVLAEDGSLVTDVLTFDEVEVRVDRPEQERFGLTVAGNLSEGRVFVTNFDPAVWDPRKMRIDYADVDDEGDSDPVAIRKADRLEDVLDFDPGKSPVYFVFEDAEGWHTAVAVPHFSVHVFQMVGLPLQVVPLLLYGVVVVGLFFVAGGVGIVLERRARAR